MTSQFSEGVDEIPSKPQDEGLGIWDSVLGVKTGALSKLFPEVEVTVEFEMDVVCRSPERKLLSVSVQGELVEQSAVISALVKARGGWSLSGGVDAEAAIDTLDAFYRAWRAALGKSVLSPEGFFGFLPSDWPKIHEPRSAVHELDNGEHILCHSYFSTWDGGNHGTGYRYNVSAYHLTNGTTYQISSYDNPQEGPQPIENLSAGGSFLD